MNAEMVIDSSIIIDFLRGQEAAARFLESARSPNATLTHAVVVAEVLTGARNLAEQRAILELFGAFQIVPVTEQDSGQSLRLLARFRLSHHTGWHDCLIASACLRLDLQVATLNDKHFRAIPGMRVVRPY